MRKRIQAFVLVATLAVQAAIPALADSASVLVGTWQRVSSKDPQGRALQPPAPASVLIFSADGHFVQLGLPAKRNDDDKPVNTFTREQLLERFGMVDASYGTYTVNGSTLKRENLSHINPGMEGKNVKQAFRVEGDMLVLVMEPPAGRFEARFKRVK